MYSSLEHINVAEENEYFKSIDGVLYTKTDLLLLHTQLGERKQSI